MSFRPFLGMLIGIGVAAALPGLATGGEMRTNPKAVLELFTSQGCASCPPADRLLTTLSDRDDLVTLAYHVDYWDYVGWPDTFGSKANSDRQRAYAKSWESGRIFTPQLVVNGRQGVVGSRHREIDTALAKSKLDLPVAVAIEGDMLKIDVPGRAGETESIVWLVTYIDRAPVTIERGENEGQTIQYSHVVTSRQMLGVWEPTTGAQLKLPLDGVFKDRTNGAVILVQDEKAGVPGPILGAAALER